MIGVYFLIAMIYPERHRDKPMFRVEWERLREIGPCRGIASLLNCSEPKVTTRVDVSSQ